MTAYLPQFRVHEVPTDGTGFDAREFQCSNVTGSGRKVSVTIRLETAEVRKGTGHIDFRCEGWDGQRQSSKLKNRAAPLC